MPKINVSVDLDEFRTIDLLQGLIMRLDDNLHDPEPKHDPYLQSMTKETKQQMLRCLRDYF
jgi:hypothetical protein